MTWHDLQELRGKGVEIGSHSATHRDFSAMSLDQVTAEGQHARETLREKLASEAKIIAFPWGRATKGCIDPWPGADMHSA
jgi:peptidoglycan/xylan/chitin deacetylase (PgdA/CDA1 family)